MEAVDDAPGTIIEEGGTYADGEPQRHRAIISGEHLDVEAYAALYTGRTKIMRLIFIAGKCGVHSMEMDALRMAYDEIKKGENTQLFREVVSKISAVDRRAELRKEKLENELNAYRTNLVKESIQIQ